MLCDQFITGSAECIDDVVFVSGHACHDTGVGGQSRQFVLCREMPNRNTAWRELQCLQTFVVEEPHRLRPDGQDAEPTFACGARLS